MNTKSLLLIPAALALGAPTYAYIGLGFNFAVPLYTPAPAYHQVAVYQPQASPSAEQVTPAPGPGYVWIAGHWSNRAQQWVWLTGHWELPPSPSAIWVDGHWVQGSAGWVWVDGAWNIGSPPTPPPMPPAPPTPPSAPAGPGPGPAQPPAAAPTVAAPPPAAPSAPAPSTPEVAEGTVVYDTPPAPIVEYIPANPYPDYVWLDGFWGWNGGWYWVAGHYGRPPHRGAVWMKGGWSHGSRGWAWHGGRWR